MKQNTSHAVMAQRYENKDSLDDFPTPPWATRALLEHVINQHDFMKLSCLEPACHQGHMSKVLDEYFKSVASSDIHDYGYGEVHDFLDSPYASDSFDWVITNPPFKQAEDFVTHALSIAKCGVAILARTVFLESVGRYNRIFSNNPPSKFAQFSERVPMVKGRLDKKASTATGYGWIVWEKGNRSSKGTELVWIPPVRKILEKEKDYDLPSANKEAKKEKKITKQYQPDLLEECA